VRIAGAIGFPKVPYTHEEHAVGNNLIVLHSGLDFAGPLMPILKMFPKEGFLSGVAVLKLSNMIC